MIKYASELISREDKQMVVVALVRHSGTPEYAVLTYKQIGNVGGLELRDIIPIYADVKVTSNSNSVEFVVPTGGGNSSPRSQTFSFAALTPDITSSFLFEIFQAYSAAQQQQLQSTGGSHKWLSSYSPGGTAATAPAARTLPNSGSYSDLTSDGAPLALSSNGTATSPPNNGDQVKKTLTGLADYNPLFTIAKTNHGGEYDPGRFKLVKDSWINSQLKAREDEFTESIFLTLFMGTWNVNGKKPGEPLEPWLLVPGFIPDIIAVGFQELDLTAGALLWGDTSQSGPWEQHIRDTLNKMGEYHMIISRQLVGVLLCIFVKAEHLPFVKEVQANVAAVGIMGMMGNKGAVGVRFTLYDSTICIVNTHLNAHLDNVQRRNQDYRDICRRLVFTQPDDQNTILTIFDHDHLFWMGDLNYRITLADSEVRTSIARGDFEYLLKHDQLVQQMKANAAFENFVEGPITFAPTYKYDPNTNQYDTSEKHRTPAWCDRILWRAPASPEAIKLLHYRRAELLTSDHRPVSAGVAIKLKRVIPAARGNVYQEIVKQLDKWEMECMPDARCTPTSLQFVDVRYLVPATQSITLENTGKVIARFKFIPRPDETKFCKPWLWVNPPYGMVVPKEKVKINITVHIDNAAAPDFNSGKEKLEDILILHIENGKDSFITIGGNYMRTSFASTLEMLVNYPFPVRNSSPIPAEATPERLSIPKELWRIVDYLYRYALDEENLFLQTGDHKEMEAIREALDTGAPLAEVFHGSVHSMAETLLRFLESLAEPVIPFSLYKQCLDSSNNYAQCKKLLGFLQTVNYNVFYYLMAFLREVLTHSHNNKLTPEKLAVVFSSILLRSPPSMASKYNESHMKRKAEFILHFISNREELTVP